jgi:hypothetical protein
MIYETDAEPSSIEFRELLKRCADDAIESAMKHRPQGAINWSYLSVTDVLWCEGLHCEGEFMIEVSEAAPDAYDLQSYMHCYITHFMPSIELTIKTDW